MNTRATGWIVSAAIASLVIGVVLAHLVEPGVGVEKVVLAGDTPAIHLFPKTSSEHPVALLAHGVTASKETLFRFGEALAAAGFDCYTVDLPGHGESRQRFASTVVVAQMDRIARAIGPVDIFVGHSMGAGAASVSVRNGDFDPKLFIAVGANPDLGERGPPLLLMAGDFDELVRPASLKARTDARLVLSPWSDHALEVWDPRLVNASVEAACGLIGKTPPPAPVFWLWRCVGVVLGMAGALGLIWLLPELSPRLTRIRGILVPGIIIIAVSLTTTKWVGSALNFHRVPLQVAIGFVFWLAYAGVGKLKLPRWTIAVAAMIFAIACVFAQARLLSIMSVIVALFACVGLILGRIAVSRGTPRDGNLAFAIFMGYAIGQWIPKFF